MALKVVLDKQTDFTGEFPKEWAKSGLWRFNEAAPDSNTCLIDSSVCNRKMSISGWSGTTADLRGGPRSNYIRINMNSPTTEKTYLKVGNDGSIFSNLGERIIVGGWMNPTTYSIDNTYTPIFNTRYGPGQPIFYVSLINGRPRISLYNSDGALILDSSVKPPFSFVAGSWYFLACMIDLAAKTAQFVVGDQSTKECWTSENLSFTGDLKFHR